MRVSKRSKIGAAVLGLALGTLAVDRFLIAGTSEGTGRNVILASVPLPAKSPPPVIPQSALAPEPSGGRDLPGKLQELARSQQLALPINRDAFRLPESWMSQFARKESSSALLTPAERFARTRHLEAVVLAAQGGTAVINGRCLSINERIGGFRLVSVTEDSAVLESGEHRVILKLKSEPERPKPF